MSLVAVHGTSAGYIGPKYHWSTHSRCVFSKNNNYRIWACLLEIIRLNARYCFLSYYIRYYYIMPYLMHTCRLITPSYYIMPYLMHRLNKPSFLLDLAWWHIAHYLGLCRPSQRNCCCSIYRFVRWNSTKNGYRMVKALDNFSRLSGTIARGIIRRKAIMKWKSFEEQWRFYLPWKARSCRRL